MTMLNISTIRAFKTLVPPFDLLTRFFDICQTFFDLRCVLEEKIILLRRTRDLLLPKLISGEVDVSDLDIDVPEEAIE